MRNHELGSAAETVLVLTQWKKNLNQLTRREFLGLTFKAAAGLALSGSVLSLLEGCGRETATPTVITPEKDSLKCRWTLDQVRSGFASPEAYLEERYRCLPEVIQAKNSGMLKGFLYSVSEEKLKTLLPELLSNISSDEKQLEHLVLSSIRGYKEKAGKGEIGTIIPEIIDVFGATIPLYVGFRENLFSAPEVNNDADVRSIIKHELQHVEDWYKGIRLNNVYLSYNTISPETFRLDFFEHLIELRAVYRELEDIFRERVEKGETSVSSLWFSSQGGNYLEHWNFLKHYPAWDLEQRTRELQFKQFKGIVPEKNNNTILIHFDLFGKREIAEIAIVKKKAR